ncbi:MAG: F0F1 ATP synthase subunit delta [Candidatus Brennerbacteria bacterium]|nr:F0F1 ATP synthase subunit delta [Candidatus Brennerbacteria bacterium]
MTKYTPKEYARALYELVAENRSKDFRFILRGFVDALRKNNDLSKGGEIVRWFEKIYHWESGKPLFEVSAADEKSGALLSRKIKGDVVFKKDPGVIGGARIRINDEMVDNTLKARLERLRGALLK